MYVFIQLEKKTLTMPVKTLLLAKTMRISVYMYRPIFHPIVNMFNDLDFFIQMTEGLSLLRIKADKYLVCEMSRKIH